MPRPLLAVAVLLTVHLARPALAEEEPAIRLPGDPAAVVLSLDLRAGLAPPRKLEGPLLVVLAGGTVRAPDVRGGHGVAEGRLTREDLHALLRFVVVEQELFAHDEKDVARRIRRKAERGEAEPPPLDGATTEIRVTLADRSKVVRQYALDATAAAHPEIEPLPRAKAVADRLFRLRVVTTAGGAAAVHRYLRLVNAACAGREPPLAPFDETHIEDAFLREGGGRSVRFRRVRMGEGRHGVSATVVDNGGKEPAVTFHEY